MKACVRWCMTGAALTVASLFQVGCQTTQVGQVLPSGYHLRDDVQYFPRGPQFPLSNELNEMQNAEAERERAGL